MNRTLAELRFATKVFMARHRVIRWAPQLEVRQEPANKPEWLKRSLARDFTGSLA
jgi:hypothetical protein